MLRKVRKDKGEPLRVIAAAVGCSIAFLGMVEAGTKAPLTAAQTIKACEALDVEPSGLLYMSILERGSVELVVSRESNEVEKAFFMAVAAALAAGWYGSEGKPERFGSYISAIASMGDMLVNAKELETA